MMEFKIESQGTDTYLVCQLPNDVQLDTVGIGMLQLNKIQGLAPMSYVKIDGVDYLRYNISSQITLEQLFHGKTDKKRFLTTIKNVISTIGLIDEYMMDPNLLLVSLDKIYVNVGSLQTSLLYYPVINENNAFSIRDFLKNLIMNMEFEQSEDSSYVTQLISYLNQVTNLSIKNLCDYITALQKSEVRVKPSIQYQDVQAVNVAPQQNVAQANNHNQINSEYMAHPQNIAPVQQPETPISDNKQPEKSKKSSFNLFGKKEPKEPKTKKKKEQAVQADFVIPGMENTKNSKLPEPPRPNGAANLNQAPLYQQVNQQTNQPVNQTAISPVSFQINNQNVSANMASSVNSNVNNLYVPNNQAMPSAPVAPVSNYQPHAGGTIVLDDGAYSKGTIVLDMDTPENNTRRPYLIRKKTGERIQINKDFFRIGQERTFVDYCVMDNPTVSRSHADILCEDGQYYIVDNNSKNHTYVNEEQIPSQTKIKLEEFARVKLANEVFEFRY